MSFSSFFRFAKVKDTDDAEASPFNIPGNDKRCKRQTDRKADRFDLSGPSHFFCCPFTHPLKFPLLISSNGRSAKQKSD
jgi:hypothetical protein